MEYCWMANADKRVRLRLPLYDGKLDLMAFCEVLEYTPTSLKLHLVKPTEVEDKPETLLQHPLDIDFTNGLSLATLEHLITEAKLLHDMKLPDGKSSKQPLVITGSALQRPPPTWLPRLKADSRRGPVPIDQVICSRFMEHLRDSIFVADPELRGFSQDALCIDDIIPGVRRPDEEDAYIDRHLPQADERVSEIKHALEKFLPAGYGWLSDEEIVGKSKQFKVPVLNDMDVLVTSATTAVLALAGEAVLGIDLVSELSWNGVLKCEADLYVWTKSSSLPYVQFVTDLKSGGVAIYCYGTQTDTFPVVHEMAAVPMPAQDVLPFISRLVSILPQDANKVSWALQAQRYMGQSRDYVFTGVINCT